MNFFFSGGVSAPPAKSNQISIETLHEMGCKVCPLKEGGAANPDIDAYGSDNPVVYLLGEAPGAEEDLQAIPFVGKSGKFLRYLFREIPNEDLRLNNCVRTRPPNNRDPTSTEIECCRWSVIEDIEKTKPKVVVLIGNVALKWAIDEGGINKWRGRRISLSIGSHVCWIYPILHPAGLLRNRKLSRNDKIIKSEAEKIFEKDIDIICNDVYDWPDAIIEDLDKLHDGVSIITGQYGEGDVKEIDRWFSKLLKDEAEVAIDIETSSSEPKSNIERRIRPYGKDSKILSVALSCGDKTVAFPLYHPRSEFNNEQTEHIKNSLYHFLSSTKSVKVGHNTGFEQEWLSFFYTGGENSTIIAIGRFLRSIEWGDTMAQAYCIDERTGALSLDSLCLQYFGFNLKDESDVDIDNLVNTLLKDVLNYNALDAKYTHKLYQKQKAVLKKDNLSKVYDDQMKRTITTVLTQMVGIDVNQKKVEYHQDRLQDNIKEILHDISFLEVVQEFEGGVKKFNPNSPKDLTEVLRDILGFDEGKQPGGGYSTAESILDLIDHPLSALVLELRHAVKLKSTYIDSLHSDAKRYIWPDAKLHPNLNTMRTVTRRLSSDSPNEQNFPKERDAEIRDMIIPREGDYFVSCDYGQIEFRVIGMASKDKVLCELIRNRYDVHTEWGRKIVDKDSSIIGGRKFLTDESTMKELRQIAKNKFVFPACFGAGVLSISDDLGISKSHVRELLKEFWDTFTGVKEWQEGLRKFYDKNGYVELLTGFRRRGPLSINKIINTPIQGTASEIVISGMNSLSELACNKGKQQFQAIINIHDDLSFSIPKATFDDDLEIIISEMLGVEYEFMNVPISIDVSFGKNWFDLSEIGTFHSDEW